MLIFTVAGPVNFSASSVWGFLSVSSPACEGSFLRVLTSVCCPLLTCWHAFWLGRGASSGRLCFAFLWWLMLLNVLSLIADRMTVHCQPLSFPMVETLVSPIYLFSVLMSICVSQDLMFLWTLNDGLHGNMEFHGSRDGNPKCFFRVIRLHN